MGEAVRKMVRPDSKGRITLGPLARGISSFTAEKDDKNRIILTPYVEIPVTEQWLFNNKLALDQVKQGLKDSFEKKISYQGKFKKYVNNNTD